MTLPDTTLTELLEAVRQFRDERNWRQFHSPKNLSMSIAIEAAELMEHFQWLTAEEAEQLPRQNSAARQAIEEELADVLIYCLSLADALSCDVSQIITAKLARNRQKYPAHLYRDRYSLPE